MFTNSDIDIETLPKVEQHSFNPLDNRYHSVMIIKSGIFSLILVALYVFFFYVKIIEDISFLKFPLSVLLVLIILLNMNVSYFGFKKKKYKLRQHDLIYKSGLWWTSETSIPFVRVQHSEVIQGPIERLFRLSKLKLYTAGGQTSDLSIPGLKPDIANDLKEFITKKVSIEEEE